jgi:hypothetical protein
MNGKLTSGEKRALDAAERGLRVLRFRWANLPAERRQARRILGPAAHAHILGRAGRCQALNNRLEISPAKPPI